MSKGGEGRAWNVKININMGITNLLPFIKTVTIAANLNSFTGKSPLLTHPAGCTKDLP